MPILPLRQRIRRSVKYPMEQEGRAVRQMEQQYRQLGYDDKSVEQNAAETFDLAQRINKKKRGLRNVKLTGIEN